MIIDIIFLILVLFAVWKGYSRGLIIAIFSFLAILIGLAAAMKFSIVVSQWLQESTNIAVQWLPVISFILVLVFVIILVRWLASLLQKSMELVMLGWFNRFGGMIFYTFLYLMIYSIVLFYATEMNIIKTETKQESTTYPIIEPLGPKALDLLSSIIPVFKNMFADLQNFFASLAQKVK